MHESSEIHNLLNIVKSRIDSHLKFKSEYDKFLALDFNFFQFFDLGENKISEVLAYFLDENQNHGQGDVFLREFLSLFCDAEFEVCQLENTCEKIITDKRRIDIYIELKGLTIGIENKVWADDQVDQLSDYSSFLDKKSGGKYILFYLNPYGLEPKKKSIDNELKVKLQKENKLKVLSYKRDIVKLINNWLVICEADNVNNFLKEFKKYLEVKFLGKKTLNMSKELRTIIFQNQREVEQLVNEYKAIEYDILNKLGQVGKELDNIDPDVDSALSVGKSGVFKWEGYHVYKFSLSKNNNKIWIQLVNQNLNLLTSYYLQDGTDVLFKEILNDLGIKNDDKVDPYLSKNEIISLFLSQVELVNQGFRIYDERMGLD
ncbi:PD-(D/E)XK nuclease family protein [Zunongwangia endophytica]|uniref:PD-(D/E)XK nuclease family protein n=1 Tax=Zunongwangia endophytica TaxID=1808945 RepID=A0ABV8HG88_9FLAO|nr:PD-(D/E)XK nuclease family protein [Zunongwangia endophytica]MDN3594656.1 PD-(D/E)XK nuclease family protein [Zunongwangia endophytica]